MAKRRPEDPPKGAPAWQSTFSDLMNLLLCFFVLLFSMSTVDAEKFQLVIASLTSSVSVLPGGSTSIGDGRLVGAGVSQLEFLDKYYNDLANSKSTTESTTEGDDKNAEEQYEQMELSDNVPVSSRSKYESNDVLSMYRALSVANYIRDNTSLNPAHIKSSGRGDYDPVADNSTPEGRARNRRVEIKVYNSYNSEFNTN